MAIKTIIEAHIDETMQGNENMVENYYKRLIELEAMGEIGTAYGGSENAEADWSVFDDILEFLCEEYEELPDWANAFIQVYLWQFQRYYEGLEVYYENFYGNTDYDSVKRAGTFLDKAGYTELASVYNQVFGDGEPYLADKIRDLFPDMRNWMDEHQKVIQEFYFDVLKRNFLTSCSKMKN